MKAKLVILIIVLGIILTALSAFIFPMGERLSSGHFLPGFPLPIAKDIGCAPVLVNEDLNIYAPLEGCANVEGLLINLAVNFVFWIAVSAGIVVLAKKIRKKNKK